MLFKGLYTFRNWLYNNSKKWATFLMSFSYISLLLWFAHLGLIHGLTTKALSVTSETPHPFIAYHACFLMLLTNWSMLLMLFLDLLMTKRIDNPIAITLINIIGVFAIIVAFGCAAGCVVDDGTIQKLGIFANPLFTVIALLCFAFTLCILKYISIKPKN